MSTFTVYGRPGCAYCYYAVKALKDGGHDFEYIDIYKAGLSKQDVAERINQPVHTMPQILHGDHYVGGCTELLGYLENSMADDVNRS